MDGGIFNNGIQMPVQLQKVNEPVNWQQVRIQFVGQIASAIIGNYEFYAPGVVEECNGSGKSRPEIVAQISLEIADVLIAELQRKGEL